MRRLMLLRHAKSDWPEGVADHERPLASRGRDAAPVIGRYMAGQGLLPDLAVVSTARRAQETWKLASANFAMVPTARPERRLYDATADDLLAVIRQVDRAVGAVLLVGHNPGLEDLALRLVGASNPVEVARLQRKFPTGALAVLDFDIDSWEQVAEGYGRLERFATPKSMA